LLRYGVSYFVMVPVASVAQVWCELFCYGSCCLCYYWCHF